MTDEITFLYFTSILSAKHSLLAITPAPINKKTKDQRGRTCHGLCSTVCVLIPPLQTVPWIRGVVCSFSVPRLSQHLSISGPFLLKPIRFLSCVINHTNGFPSSIPLKNIVSHLSKIFTFLHIRSQGCALIHNLVPCVTSSLCKVA